MKITCTGTILIKVFNSAYESETAERKTQKELFERKFEKTSEKERFD